jgi:ADP-ribose pyrophosphatase
MNSETIPIESAYQYCPRCGTKTNTPGAIPFRCPAQACQFVAYLGPVAAVGALIIDDQSNLLLVRRSRDPGKGLWGLPGGFVDRDETIEQALAREVLEETQLQLASQELILTGPNHYAYQGVVAPVIDLFYLCKASNPESIKLAADELNDFTWTRPDAYYLDAMAFESNRRAVEFWLSRSSS